MAKRSKKGGADSNLRGGGIVGAVTQDIELTVEQAEEAAKKAAHKAAVALGIASDEQPAKPSSKAGSTPAKQTTPPRSSTSKPKG
jgi:hypothetical protein